MNLNVKEIEKLLIRPTIVITTCSPNGVSNAAPFSWSSPMATTPKSLFGFSSGVNHDTWRNIKANREFVVNLIGEQFGPLLNVMAQDFPYEVSEIKECGLTETSSTRVKPPRIKEAYGWLECYMTHFVTLSPHNLWIIGEVLIAEVKDQAIDEVVVVEKVKPLNHISGEAFVTEMKIIRF